MLPNQHLLTSLLLFSVTVPLLAGTWTPDPSLGNVDAHRRLYEIGRAYCDAHFDPAANTVRTKPNKGAHLVRESAYYAYGLLLTGDPADRATAQLVIKNVLKTQDTRAHSDWRGAFLWQTEGNWATAKNPDLNSAAFVGTALVNIAALDDKTHCLDPDVRVALNAAGKLAVEELMRRNVDPGYTNIALLSTGFAAAGVKLWSVPGADKWADKELSTVLNAAKDGAVCEYLCPTYTGIDLDGAYTARQFAFSDAFAAKADAMINHLWKEVALSYHAPSYQLGGPYNRAYGDDMLTYAADLKYWIYLALDGKYPLPAQPDIGHGWDQGGLVMLASVPVTPRPEFQQTPPTERDWSAIGADDRHLTRSFHQFRDGNFILGTVLLQDEWKQKRNLVADWRTDVSTPPGYQIGFCIDETNETLPAGFPAATIQFRSQQKGNAALVELSAEHGLPPSGNWSLRFDTNASTADSNTNPVVVKDGAITTYIYNVSKSPIAYQTQTDTTTDQKTFQVNRPWSTADALGKVHIIAYLVVYRAADKPAPKVTDIALKDDAGQINVSATVDGTPLAITSPD